MSLFSHALEVTEENHVAHAFLGAAYAERGQLAETIRHYREAVRIRPDFRTAANNLAWLLATARDPSLRDPALAVSLAERAAALSAAPDPSVLDTLAAAYAAAGRYGEAARVAEQALRQVGGGRAARLRRADPRAPRALPRRAAVSGMTHGDQVHGRAAAQDRLDQGRRETERRADQEREPQPGAGRGIEGRRAVARRAVAAACRGRCAAGPAPDSARSAPSRTDSGAARNGAPTRISKPQSESSLRSDASGKCQRWRGRSRWNQAAPAQRACRLDRFGTATTSRPPGRRIRCASSRAPFGSWRCSRTCQITTSSKYAAG